jgi:predicted CXXCH cytochrome family protein
MRSSKAAPSLRRWLVVGPALLLAWTTILLAQTGGHETAITGAGEADERPLATQPAQPSVWSHASADRLRAGFAGGPHDFSAAGSQPHVLCVSCHVPSAPPTSQPALDEPADETQPLRPYQAIGVELNSASLMCVSCHDGVIASDVYTSAHATTFASQLGVSLAGPGRLGGHPIGVRYPTADPEYHPLAAVRADRRIKLPEGRIQCTTCHDPHNTEGHPHMLVTSNERSRLCLACHRL